MVKIPVSKVNVGLRGILQNSRRINHLAKRTLKDWEDKGTFSVKQHHNKYSIILFYYAVEELGKAIYLQELKDQADSENLDFIDNPDLFKKHDVKLKKAQEKYPGLIVPKFEQEMIDAKTYRLVASDQEIVNGFLDRSDLFLVSFDESQQKWINDLSDIIHDEELLKKIMLLDSILDKLQDIHDDQLSKDIRKLGHHTD